MPSVADGEPTQAREVEPITDFDALESAIEQTTPLRSPGLTMRPHRVREWVLLRTLDLLRTARAKREELSIADAQRAAEANLATMAADPDRRAIEKAFEATAPSSRSVAPSDTDAEVERAAVMWLPSLRWLSTQLLAKTNKRGFPAKRGVVLATFLFMAFAKVRPEVWATKRSFERGHTLRSWSFDYPEGSPTSKHFYESLHTMLAARDPQMAMHINVELFRQLVEQRDARGKLRHPDAGKVLVVDGCLIEADVQQKADRSAVHRHLLNGAGRSKVRYVPYVDGNGNVKRFARGYKLVVLVDLATTLPVTWTVIAASDHEPTAAWELIKRLYELWPECPVHTLVGDALYDTKVLADKLTFEAGIRPCFPKGANVDYADGLKWRDTGGIPECECGDLMKFKDDNGEYWSAAKRRQHRVPLGERRGEKARNRFVCANGNPRCKPKGTMPADDPRLYGYWHRGGQHSRAIYRRIYLLRRNAVESLFATLQEQGLGGKRLERADWATDHEMDWLLSCGLMYLTARRLVHETGLYQEALDEALELGLLDQPTLANPAPGPDAIQLASMRRARFQRLGEPAPPRTWQSRQRASVAAAA